MCPEAGEHPGSLPECVRPVRPDVIIYDKKLRGNKIKWQSEASEAFKARFMKLKKNIVDAFDSIENSFTKLMQQTLDDIQATENANTVK